MTPKVLSRRQQAAEHLEHALSESAQALTKLGGKTRFKPRELPAPNTYLARQYIEGIINRLRVVQHLVAIGDGHTPQQVDSSLDFAVSESPLTPRDEFEREYESTRRPEC